MNKITRVGLDIAKNIFVLHAVNAHGKTVKCQTLSRSKVLSFFAQTEPCLVDIESNASSQYWAREIRQFCHTLKLVPFSMELHGINHVSFKCPIINQRL